jgi:hypothetical protein
MKASNIKFVMCFFKEELWQTVKKSFEAGMKLIAKTFHFFAWLRRMIDFKPVTKKFPLRTFSVKKSIADLLNCPMQQKLCLKKLC